MANRQGTRDARAEGARVESVVQSCVMGGGRERREANNSDERARRSPLRLRLSGSGRGAKRARARTPRPTTATATPDSKTTTTPTPTLSSFAHTRESSRSNTSFSPPSRKHYGRQRQRQQQGAGACADGWSTSSGSAPGAFHRGRAARALAAHRGGRTEREALLFSLNRHSPLRARARLSRPQVFLARAPRSAPPDGRPLAPCMPPP
jgi:hypothetical protein